MWTQAVCTHVLYLHSWLGVPRVSAAFRGAQECLCYAGHVPFPVRSTAARRTEARVPALPLVTWMAWASSSPVQQTHNENTDVTGQWRSLVVGASGVLASAPGHSQGCVAHAAVVSFTFDLYQVTTWAMSFLN